MKPKPPAARHGSWIDAFELLAIAIPAPSAFRIRTAAFVETTYLVCRLNSGTLTGSGYAFMFDRDDALALIPLLRHLVESEIVGRSLPAPREANRRLFSHLAFTGAGGIGASLVGAIDMALWDLMARSLGTSFAVLAGAETASPVDAYVTCGSLDASPEAVGVEVRRAKAEGFSAAKIKVGGDPDADDARVRAARDAVGPGMRLMVDANQSWDYKLACRMIDRWRPLDLHWVEEPIDAFDFDGIRRLRERSDTRIAVGESYYTAEPFRRLLADRVTDVLTVNPQKVGGITPFLDIIGAANLLTTSVTCHTFAEVAGQLLAPARLRQPVEVVPWMLGAFADSPSVSRGQLLPYPGPGLGLELSPEALESRIVARVEGP